MIGSTMGLRQFIIIIITGWLLLFAGSVAAQEPAPAAAVDSLGTDVTVSPDQELPATVDLEPPTPDYWSTGVSSTAAVLMTPIFPGWGQLYTDNSWRAALAYGLEMFYWSNMLARDRRAVRAQEFSRTFPMGDPNRARYDAIAKEDWEQMRDFAWWSGGVLLIIALDSYVGAHLFNFEQDAVPVPNDWEGQFGPSHGDFPVQDSGPSILVFQHAWRF